MCLCFIFILELYNMKELKETILSKQNINLLWEVLIDEPSIKNITKDERDNLYTIFSNNLVIFNENNKNTDLTQSNKTFLSQMIRMIRSNTSATASSKKVYKVEDIQAQRQKVFDEQLAQKRTDFEASMIVQKPPIPNFTEKIENEKIKGMDELIAKTVAQRNFDISQINMNPATDWLQPQQTSVKLNKIKIQDDVSSSIVQHEIIELSKGSKKLTWNDEKNETKVFDITEAIISTNINRAPLIESNFSILNKLKKIAEPLEPLETATSYNELKQQMTNLEQHMTNLEQKLDIIVNSIKQIVEIVNSK